jgi:hypothetical protein
MSKVNYISTVQTKKNVIKLPAELANHPNLDDAVVTIKEDTIVFQLPPAKPQETLFADVWQYVHHKKTWVCVTFTK